MFLTTYFSESAVFGGFAGGTTLRNVRSKSSADFSSTSSSRAFFIKRVDCSLARFKSFVFADMNQGFRRTRLSIHQASPNDTTKGTFGAIFIFDDKSRTIAVPEIILCQISVQVIFAAMLIDALHAALEDAEIAFDGVGVDFATPVFTPIVVNNAMLGKFATKQGVVGGFIGHQASFAIEILTHQWGQGRRLEVINYHAPYLPGPAVHQGKHLVLVSVATAFLLTLGLHGLVVTDESLIDLDNAAVAAHKRQVVRPHGFAYTMAHEPSGLEGNAQGPVQLVRADTLLAGAKKEHRLKPDMQLDVARLEDGPDLDGERLPAGVALVGAYAGALALELVAFVNNAAMRADTPVGPNPSLDKCVSRFFVVEMGR